MRGSTYVYMYKHLCIHVCMCVCLCAYMTISFHFFYEAPYSEPLHASCMRERVHVYVNCMCVYTYVDVLLGEMVHHVTRMFEKNHMSTSLHVEEC